MCNGKKNKNENTDNTALIGIGAFLVGAAFAKPSQESVQQLHQFRSNEHLFNQYKLDYYDFQQYLHDRRSFDEFKQERLVRYDRWRGLGNLQINQRISNSPKISNAFNEAVNMYFAGFFKGACISCAIVMEVLLKDKFGNKKLIELIDEAKNSQMITSSERHYLHAIRLDRNSFVHAVEQEISENEAKIVILTTSKIINKIL